MRQINNLYYILIIIFEMKIVFLLLITISIETEENSTTNDEPKTF